MNKQKPEKQVSGGMFLEVNDIFDSIQGEGPFSGRSATFVRLAGCNIQCEWCDTEYTTRESLPIEYIIGKCKEYGNNLVVLTGGEPMRQEIAPLIHLLEQEDFLVQIETNGILWSIGIEETGCTIVCSPKTSKVHPNIYILRNTTSRVYIKMVVGANCYPTQPGMKGGDVLSFHDADYIIPLDSGWQNSEQNYENMQLAIKFVKVHKDVALQLQIHKILEVK